jgi:hypothetical protein
MSGERAYNAGGARRRDRASLRRDEGRQPMLPIVPERAQWSGTTGGPKRPP